MRRGWPWRAPIAWYMTGEGISRSPASPARVRRSRSICRYIEPEGASPAAVRPAAAKEPGRGEPATILVVDDETGIRELIRKILRRERYRVLEAGTAEEALSLSQTTAAQGQSIDLLITDVMLPGIHGPELARRMQQAAPIEDVVHFGYTRERKRSRRARDSWRNRLRSRRCSKR